MIWEFRVIDTTVIKPLGLSGEFTCDGTVVTHLTSLYSRGIRNNMIKTHSVLRSKIVRRL